MKVPVFDVSVMVMGMHRSGTSALSKLISLHGFGMPATLLGGNAKNESGFWESSRVNSLNNDLLGEFGQTWFSVDPLDPTSMVEATRHDFDRRGKELVLDEFRDVRRIVLKDPRACRVGWFWRDLLKSMSHQVVVPISVRSPVEVANSLETRNGFNPSLSYLIWLRNYIDAEHLSRGMQRSFLCYDDLLDDWRAVMERVSADLGLPLHADERNAAEIDGFLNPDLRHHSVAHASVMAQLSGTPWVAEAYEIFHRAGKGSALGKAERTALDNIRRAFDAAVPAFSDLVSSGRVERKKADGLRQQIAQANKELSEARNTKGDLTELRLQIEAQGKAIEVGASTWSDLIRDQSAQLGELHRAIERSRERENAALAVQAATQSRSEAIERRAEELALRVEEQARALAESDVRRERLSAKLKAAELEKAGIMAQLTSVQVRVDDLSHQVDLQRTALDRSDDDRRQLFAALEASDAEILRLTTALHEASMQARELSGSLESKVEEFTLLRRRHHDLADKYKAVKNKNHSQRHEIAIKSATILQLQSKIEKIERRWIWRAYSALLSIFSLFSLDVFRRRHASRRFVRQQVAILRQSGLFDNAWYLDQYPDVRESGVEPMLHYASHGWEEGRSPNPNFNGRLYLQRNPDVAAAGVNPLIHYIQHGREEGRGPTGFELPESHPRTAEAPSAANVFPDRALPDPHPVYRGAIPTLCILPWRTWAEIVAGNESVSVDETAAVLPTLQLEAQGVDGGAGLLALFRTLSGDGAWSITPESSRGMAVRGEAAELADAWFASEFSLRLRWKLRDQGSIVVFRGFQFSQGQGEYRLVGEAPIRDELDYVDFALVNPFYPLLIAGYDAEGRILFLVLLPYPSMFRGALHYSELVAQHGQPDQPIDILGFVQTLVQRAEPLYRQVAQPLLSGIKVDIGDADGTEPIFNEHFRQWLLCCLGVSVAVHATDEARGETVNAHLSQRLTSLDRAASTTLSRTDGNLTLVIPASDVPSLQLLLASKVGSGKDPAPASGAVAVSHVVADRDNLLPEVEISLPSATSLLSSSVMATKSISVGPRYQAADGVVPSLPFPAAISLQSTKHPGQAELLFPVSSSVYPLTGVAGNARRVFVAMGKECLAWEHVAWVLEALKNQKGVGEILLAGATADVQQLPEMCDRLFPNDAEVGAPISNRLDAAGEDDLVLYLGADIVLHDQRSMHTLAGLLASPSVASSSCMLVEGREGKKGWSAGVASGGFVGFQRFGEDAASSSMTDMRWLWRSLYPVLTPSPTFWMARALDVRNALLASGGDAELSPPAAEDGRMHVCTSLVSASILSPRLLAARSLDGQSIKPERTTNATHITVLRG